MSSPALPRSPAATSPMRQQLDELDALLQRMLTLPVNQLPEPEGSSGGESQPPPSVVRPRTKLPSPVEPASNAGKPGAEEPAPAPEELDMKPAASVRHEPPTRMRGPIVVYQPINNPAALSVAEMPAIDEEKVPVRAASIAATVVVSRADPAAGWGAAAEEPPPLPALEPAKPVEHFLPEPHSPFLERHRARLREKHRAAPWLGPLGWINVLFDRCIVALGRPGLWLVRSEGRNVLGWIGLGLLLAAGVILVGDWFGWTW